MVQDFSTDKITHTLKTQLRIQLPIASAIHAWNFLQYQLQHLPKSIYRFCQVQDSVKQWLQNINPLTHLLMVYWKKI